MSNKSASAIVHILLWLMAKFFLGSALNLKIITILFYYWEAFHLAHAASLDLALPLWM